MNENAKKWIGALRSGKFKQGQNFLCRIPDGEAPEYCCLGVACELYIREGGDLPVKAEKRVGGDIPIPESVLRYGNTTAVLPAEVVEWLGMTNYEGQYLARASKYNSLIGHNDGGDTFEQIADVIESEPEGLFAEEA